MTANRRTFLKWLGLAPVALAVLEEGLKAAALETVPGVTLLPVDLGPATIAAGETITMQTYALGFRVTTEMCDSDDAQIMQNLSQGVADWRRGILDEHATNMYNDAFKS